MHNPYLSAFVPISAAHLLISFELYFRGAKIELSVLGPMQLSTAICVRLRRSSRDPRSFKKSYKLYHQTRIHNQVCNLATDESERLVIVEQRVFEASQVVERVALDHEDVGIAVLVVVVNQHVGGVQGVAEDWK
jgi:hypothetical protein